MTGITKKYDFFISYRRANNGTVCGSYLARLLSGYNVFYDVRSISEGTFDKQIRAALENTERFILVVTDGAFSRPMMPGQRDWYYEEIKLAIETIGLDKITPIIFSGDFNENVLPESLKNKGLTTCQKISYVPEYSEYFEEKFYKHLRIGVPEEKQFARHNTIPSPSEQELQDSTEFDETEISVPQSFPVLIDGKDYGKMVYVKRCTFQMGSEDGDDDEKPIHSVTLTRGYYIGEVQVTQELWESVMTVNPSDKDARFGDSYPVNNVSWNDCFEFVKKLNTLSNHQFRLPTEAEWENAARNGGEKIIDFTSHVLEWCQDYFDWYPSEPSIDPKGPDKGSFRVMRGGNETIRHGFNPRLREKIFGLRLVCDC